MTTQVQQDCREKGRGRRRKLSVESEAAAVAAYVAGEWLSEIFKSFGITKPTLYKALDRAGVPRDRARRGPPKENGPAT